MPNFSCKDLKNAGHNTASNSNYSNLVSSLKNRTNIFKLFFTGLLLISIISCENENRNKSVSIRKSQIKKYNLADKQQFYYHSSNNNRKYDYLVTGTDENGKNVKGIINIENEIAIGILKGNNNTEIEIISDKIIDDKIIASDINGLEYKLKID
jgi:hypothetical protein